MKVVLLGENKGKLTEEEIIALFDWHRDVCGICNKVPKPKHFSIPKMQRWLYQYRRHRGKLVRSARDKLYGKKQE